MFRYVEPLRPVGIVVSTPKKFSKHRVVPASAVNVGAALDMTASDSRFFYSFGLYMPTSEIILQNSNETLFRIIKSFSAG